MAIVLIIGMVLAGAVIFQLLGMLWYGPLFGSLWKNNLKIDKKKVMGARATVFAVSKSLLLLATCYIVAVYVMLGLSLELATLMHWVFVAFVMAVVLVLHTSRALSGWAYTLDSSVILAFVAVYIAFYSFAWGVMGYAAIAFVITVLLGISFLWTLYTNRSQVAWLVHQGYVLTASVIVVVSLRVVVW